jgi:anaphase-promoting complex subunit 2
MSVDEPCRIKLFYRIDKRLMHPGAETTDIVEFYISTIKYLRVLDPSGVMLELASGVIGKYLR